MSEIKPNHICKNIKCTKGIDGGRKHYYACDSCDRTFNWKSVACCLECYQEFNLQVIEARSKNKQINILPERTDMNESEVKELLNKSEEVVLEQTKNKLKDYIEDETNVNYTEVVDKINKEIDNKFSKKKRNKGVK